MMFRSFSPTRFLVLGMVLSASVVATAGLDVPAYESRPGAAYTVYLNFGGFNYTGSWAGKTPGATRAYGNDGDYGSFSSSEQKNIKEVWARVAEKYAAFNVNVTTIDPAKAAGKASSDSERQSFYDTTARVMHTVVGGRGAWIGGGGYSYIGTTKASYPNLNGAKTNWVFAEQAPNNLGFVGEAVAHENGHGLGLNHQSDLGRNLEYSSNGNHQGNGSYAPTMGNSYSSQRGLWRNGTYRSNNIQNDVKSLLSFNDGMETLMDDGIGHSLATATSLALNGSNVDSLGASGIIVPKSSTDPNPIGVDNYTKDYFSFNTSGGAVSLQLNAGSQRIETGVADPGATFDGNLRILDAKGNLIASGVRDSSTLFSLFEGSLSAGKYYAMVESFGGYTSTREAGATYFTLGSYFLTGRGFAQAVPEPASLAALGLGALALLKRRKKA